ncbi:cytochrome P450 2B4-like [Synchiropus picturatus]
MDFTVVVAGLILVLIWWFSGNIRHKSKPPPGPTGLPLLGNLLQLDRKAPFKTFLELSKTYGPVFTVHMGLQRVVVLVGYDAVKEALVEQAEEFAGRGKRQLLNKLTNGYGVLLSNGERTRQLRRFTLSTLRDFGMGRKGVEEWIQDEARHLCNKMYSFKGSVFNPKAIVGCSVANVICCLVFGRRFDHDDKEFLRLFHILNEIMEISSSPLGQIYNLFPTVMGFISGRLQNLFALMSEFQTFTRSEVTKHAETLDPNSPRDYIDSFLIQIEQDKDDHTSEFHHQNLIGMLLALFLAGTETTSSTIRYALGVLMKYPEVQERMQKEVDGVIGKDRAPNVSDRKLMPFSDAVIHEVQRCLDIVPYSVPHHSLTDISFRGYTIPKDTAIIPLLHSVLREEKHWKTPWSFSPDNFLNPDGSFKKNPAFLAFSAGRRVCLGESLARMELFLFMVSLVQKFTFSCPGGPDSVNLVPEYSMMANVAPEYELMATPR